MADENDNDDEGGDGDDDDKNDDDDNHDVGLLFEYILRIETDEYY